MSHMSNAAGAMAAVVREISPDQLASSTPCTEFDVRGLVNHLLYWGPSLEAAGRKELVPPPSPDADLTAGDWRGDLLAQLDRTVTSWAPASAWEGTTRVVGPAESPATMIGTMVLTELLVHGWDLAAATGQKVTVDDDLLAHVHADLVANAEMGREMGVYGPEVVVPAGAPVLDRVLGLTGRDPAWT